MYAIIWTKRLPNMHEKIRNYALKIKKYKQKLCNKYRYKCMYRYYLKNNGEL